MLAASAGGNNGGPAVAVGKKRRDVDGRRRISDGHRSPVTGKCPASSLGAAVMPRNERLQCAVLYSMHLHRTLNLRLCREDDCDNANVESRKTGRRRGLCVDGGRKRGISTRRTREVFRSPDIGRSPGWAAEWCGRLEMGLVMSPERGTTPRVSSPGGPPGFCEENDSCSATEA
ncbi:hypothetical protein MRX96_047602 [Rhipicephalus microplus]